MKNWSHYAEVRASKLFFLGGGLVIGAMMLGRGPRRLFHWHFPWAARFAKRKSANIIQHSQTVEKGKRFSVDVRGGVAGRVHPAKLMTGMLPWSTVRGYLAPLHWENQTILQYECICHIKVMSEFYIHVFSNFDFISEDGCVLLLGVRGVHIFSRSWGDHCRLVQTSRLATPRLKETPRPVRGAKSAWGHLGARFGNSDELTRSLLGDFTDPSMNMNFLMIWNGGV